MPRSDDRWLVCRVDARLAAVELSVVIEVMRPLPIEPLAGAPDGVLGAAVVRGAPTPVVDLAKLIGGGAGEVRRWITVRADGCAVALAVTDVIGVRVLSPASLVDVPPLLRNADDPIVAKLAARDGALMTALSTARILPDQWPAKTPEGLA